jgi:hypothetical protein
MKIALKVATVLSWFNLVWWTLNIVSSLSSVTAFGAPMLMLALLVLLASIPLNAYASLQLHKSIRRPSVKLNAQTPIGIRFVGLAAQFLGVIMTIVGIVLLLNATKIAAMPKDQVAGTAEMRALLSSVRGIRFVGGFFLFLGLCVSVNVVLNFRLLRWYYLVKQSDVS